MLALGFVGGDVSLLLLAAAASAVPSLTVACASAAAADVGAVRVVPRHLLAARGAAGWRGAMLAADAAGSVRLWGVRSGGAAAEENADAPSAPPSLECLRAIHLGTTMQPTCLGISAGTLVCGCADGTVVAAALPIAAPLRMVDGAAADAAISVGDIDVAFGETTGGAVGDGGDGGAGEGGSGRGRLSYEWCFDSGAGPQGRGTVVGCRRAFDGWAKTLAFEAGLQAVLAKMNQSRGVQGTGSQSARGGSTEGGGKGSGGGGGGGGGGGSATAHSTGGGAAAGGVAWRPGMHATLFGLAARPELNGSVVQLLGCVDEKSGRAPVRLVAPAGVAGTAIKVKPANLKLVT